MERAEGMDPGMITAISSLVLGLLSAIGAAIAWIDRRRSERQREERERQKEEEARVEMLNRKVETFRRDGEQWKDQLLREGITPDPRYWTWEG